ncbi:guanosine-3',5'-bis(diphosphate) 3'-pyrophosphohydrolase MESH1, partial [Aphelenchoides avenae]
MDSPTKMYPDIPPEKHISDEERRRNDDALKAMQLVTKAADFAAKKHRFQKRKDAKQTPYINHPIGVAYNLTHIAKVSDPITLAGAYLHDT